MQGELLIIEKAILEVDSVIEKLWDCFVEYQGLLQKNKSWLKLKNSMSANDIIKKGEEEFGFFNVQLFCALQKTLKKTSDFLRNEFYRSHYNLSRDILKSLKCAQSDFEHQKSNQIELNINIDTIYELVDTLALRAHCKLYGATLEDSSKCEEKVYSIEYECFIRVKAMMYPIVSQVYHRLVIKLFPYINNILNKLSVILEKNLFNKLQINQFINVSLNFVLKLLIIENKVKNNLDDNNLALKQVLVEISEIKSNLEQLAKGFFGFLIQVIEKKIFSITIDQNGNSHVNVSIEGLNKMVIKNLHQLNALYLKIFQLEKKLNTMIVFQQVLEVVNSQSEDNDQKYILDLLTAEPDAYNTDPEVSSIEDIIIVENETMLQKISRIFINIPKYKLELLAVILSGEELTFTNEEIAKWEDINIIANEVTKSSYTKEECVVVSLELEKDINETSTQEMLLSDNNKELDTQQQGINELDGSIGNTSDMSLESLEKNIAEEIVLADDNFAKDISYNNQRVLFVHSPYYYFGCNQGVFVHSPYYYFGCELEKPEPITVDDNSSPSTIYEDLSLKSYNRLVVS